MKRLIVGSLAFVGALTLLFTCGLVALAVLGAASTPTVPERVVLELELDGPLPEQKPEASLGSLGSEQLTVRDVVDALERAGEDARVQGLVVHVGSAPLSFAAVQEVRDAVKAFRAKGKQAVVYTDGFDGFTGATGAYYLASAFDQVYIQPSGRLAVLGVALELPFARGALEKLGVQPRFGRRAEYKDAVNLYTEQGPTAPQREATERLLTSLFGQVVRGIAEERALEEAAVRAAIDAAPLTAQQALEAKLVDGLLYRDEVYARVREAAGASAQLLYLEKYLERAGRPHERGQDKVALVYGVGQVARGRSQGNPLTGESVLGADTVAAALRHASEDSQVKAIILRVDSPGGSYVASDSVRREVQRARERGKPVIASLGSVAASGGYFIALEADKVVAQPGTLTGSIGVYSGKFITAGLWEKLGVNWELLGAGRNAGLNSSDADFTPEQLAAHEADLDRIYEDFTRRAAERRKLPLEQLQLAARGRAWTGEDAKERGLVDELGGLPVALRLAREAAGLGASAPVRVEEYPRRRTAAEVFAELLGGRSGDNSEEVASTRVQVGEPLAPVLAPVRALQQVGGELGLWPQRPGELSAPLPQVSW